MSLVIMVEKFASDRHEDDSSLIAVLCNEIPDIVHEFIILEERWLWLGCEVLI